MNMIRRLDVALQGIPGVLIKCQIKTDKDSMQRVITNLVNNANRYTINPSNTKGCNNHQPIYISVANEGHHLQLKELTKIRRKICPNTGIPFM